MRGNRENSGETERGGKGGTGDRKEETGDRKAGKPGAEEEGEKTGNGGVCTSQCPIPFTSGTVPAP